LSQYLQLSNKITHQLTSMVKLQQSDKEMLKTETRLLLLNAKIAAKRSVNGSPFALFACRCSTKTFVDREPASLESGRDLS